MVLLIGIIDGKEAKHILKSRLNELWKHGQKEKKISTQDIISANTIVEILKQSRQL